ncbi:phospho-acceptor domain-containing protein [Scopulibacillus darangshiensis]|uniref:histidine kinase n=1 Tax=Scopulibacillus darangshiensis TaxID=442528 RepID=A0A4R2PBJ3_9BACL|nr:HAMP domain-containing sensor histidine kinase [Scopulibacillus darangshiensis]TCP32367.1 phospho-acceptor domain-containing protein [Scopulibacillus darangshiensis]
MISLGEGLVIYSYESSVSTLTNQSFENELSFEIRFRVAPNGKIIDSNPNGQALIKDIGDQFFYTFARNHRHQAFLFFKEITSSTDVIEKVLYHQVSDKIKKVRYRGKCKDNHILLAGYEINEVDTSLKSLLGKMEIILNTLTVSVALVDRNNQFIYNDFQEFATKVDGPENHNDDYSFRDLAKNMINEVRRKRTTCQWFHVHKDNLFHIHAIYFDETEQIIFVIDNRTETNEFNSLIKHKQQMESVSHLAAGFAHELRNPLSVIRGFIQLSGLTNNIGKYYQTILSEIDRMNNIVEDFLSLSRKTSRKRAQDPNGLFNSLIPLIRSECLLRKINFDYDFEKTERKIYFDDSMIKQIILNLLRNAVEAFDENQTDRHFVIKTAVNTDEYRVTISDNGPGMKKSVLDQLGKPFFTTKETGTGIGLPLCKKIVEDHYGDFIIKSTLGEGTTIIFTLPFLEK